MNDKIKELIRALGIEQDVNPQQESLFLQAITHKSYLLEHPECNLEYDRLEFLGDAILKFVINEYLFVSFPTYNSGDLTKLSAYILSDKTLCKIAIEFNLKRFALAGSRINSESILADVMESLIGAIYLTLGFDQSRNFILKCYEKLILEADSSELKENYKAALQELTQSKKLGLPEYFVIRADGPAHNPNFEMEIRLSNGEVLGRGSGTSKKEAGQAAAENSLDYLQEKYAQEVNLLKVQENSQNTLQENIPETLKEIIEKSQNINFRI